MRATVDPAPGPAPLAQARPPSSPSLPLPEAASGLDWTHLLHAATAFEGRRRLAMALV